MAALLLLTVGCADRHEVDDEAADLGGPLDPGRCLADGFAPLTELCYGGPCCEAVAVDLLPENGCRPICPSGFSTTCMPDPAVDCAPETYASCDADHLCAVVGCDADGELVSALRWRMTAAPETTRCEPAELSARAAARCDPEGLCEAYDPLDLPFTECVTSADCAAYVPSCWHNGEDFIGEAGWISAHGDDFAAIEAFACPRGPGTPTTLLHPWGEAVCDGGRCVRP